MSRLLFILAVSFGSLFLGYLAQLLLLRLRVLAFDRIRTVSTVLKIVALIGLQPIPILDSFWKLSLDSAGLLVFPLLGALSIVIGGTCAIALIRILRIPPYRAGSVFTCGMFTNLGTFGSLIAFVMFGDRGFMLVQLFTMFEVFIYYAIGFPLSHQISRGALQDFRFSFGWLKEKPAAFVPLAAIAAGAVLRATGVPRPALMEPLAAVLIPLVTGLLGFAIGLTLRVARVRDYRLEVGLVLGIKYVAIPLIMIPLGLLLGLHRTMGGVPLKVLAIMSFMPSAFIALVPPAIYDFDLDLANSGWIVTTLALLLIFPVLYLLLA